MLIIIFLWFSFQCGHPTDDIQWCFCMPLIQAKCKHLWCSLISFKLVALVNTLIQYIEKMTSSKVENHKFLLLFLDFLTVSEIWFTFVRIKNKTFSVVVFYLWINGYVISSSWWKYCNMVWSSSKLFTRWLSRSLSQQRYVKHTICLSL